MKAGEPRHRLPWDVGARYTVRAVALALALAGPGHAQSGGEQSARRLFREGHAAIAAGDYATAVQRFERAHEAWPNPKIRLNIATTLKALGRRADAANAYATYLREVDAGSDKREEVAHVLQELTPHLARVRVADELLGRAELDGKPLPDPSVTYFVEPGTHVLTVQLPRGRQQRQLVLSAGQQFTARTEPEAPPPSRPAAFDEGSSANGTRAEGSKPAAPDKAIASHGTALVEATRSDETAPEPANPGLDSRALSRWFMLARVDVDGSGGGAVAALGFSYELADHVHASWGALLGTNQGAFVGLDVSPWLGRLRPTFGVSVPAFAIAGLRPGMAADVGVRLALSPRWYPFARASVVHFPSLPEAYASTVFVPCAGLEVKL